MRTFAMASILLTTLVLGTDAASAAPWCTEAVKGGGTNCGFYSFQQCMASASGNGGVCRQNQFGNTPAARCNGAIAAAIKDLSGREHSRDRVPQGNPHTNRTVRFGPLGAIIATTFGYEVVGQQIICPTRRMRGSRDAFSHRANWPTISVGTDQAFPL